MAAASKLEGLKVRVVSMPSTSLFDRQPIDYRRSVLLPGVPTISIEAASTLGWEKYAHLPIGMKTFGASAPYKEVYARFGLTGEAVAAKAQAFLGESLTLGVSVGALPTHFDL